VLHLDAQDCYIDSDHREIIAIIEWQKPEKKNVTQTQPRRQIPKKVTDLEIIEFNNKVQELDNKYIIKEGNKENINLAAAHVSKILTEATDDLIKQRETNKKQNKSTKQNHDMSENKEWGLLQEKRWKIIKGIREAKRWNNNEPVDDKKLR
jgi:hypothetical protein